MHNAFFLFSLWNMRASGIVPAVNRFQCVDYAVLKALHETYAPLSLQMSRSWVVLLHRMLIWHSLKPLASVLVWDCERGERHSRRPLRSGRSRTSLNGFFSSRAYSGCSLCYHHTSSQNRRLWLLFTGTFRDTAKQRLTLFLRLGCVVWSRRSKYRSRSKCEGRSK